MGCECEAMPRITNGHICITFLGLAVLAGVMWFMTRQGITPLRAVGLA